MKILHVVPRPSIPPSAYGGPIRGGPITAVPAPGRAAARRPGAHDQRQRPGVPSSRSTSGARVALALTGCASATTADAARVSRSRPLSREAASVLPCAGPMWCTCPASTPFRRSRPLLACRLLGSRSLRSPHGALQRWAHSRRVVGKKLFELACRAVMPRTVVCHVASAEEGEPLSPRRLRRRRHPAARRGHPARRSRRRPEAAAKRAPDAVSRWQLDPIKGHREPADGVPGSSSTLPALKWSLRIVGGGDDLEYTIRQLDEKVPRSFRADGTGRHARSRHPAAGARTTSSTGGVDLVVVPSHPGKASASSWRRPGCSGPRRGELLSAPWRADRGRALRSLREQLARGAGGRDRADPDDGAPGDAAFSAAGTG